MGGGRAGGGEGSYFHHLTAGVRTGQKNSILIFSAGEKHFLKTIGLLVTFPWMRLLSTCSLSVLAIRFPIPLQGATRDAASTLVRDVEAGLVLRVVAVEEEGGLVGGAEERLGDERPAEAVDDRAGLQRAAADLQVVVDGLGGEVEELQLDT